MTKHRCLQTMHSPTKSKLNTRLGKVKGEPINIKLKEGTVPYCLTAPRHVPLPLYEELNKEIRRMEKLGVIRKVDEPTDWCRPIVIVPKPNGTNRLCIDLTKLNQGVERELYQLESVDETIAKLGDECVVMSNSRYWQVPLNEESQLYTTFITPIGRFCCTRGPFGMNSMQEIFNKKMDAIIEGLPGIAKSTDDFLIYAKTEEGHDERLRSLLHRFKENGVTVNPEKCQFRQTKLEFLAYNLSQEGITPITEKMSAITDYKQPENLTELRQFMGMANQLGKFTPNLPQASAPLRELLSTKNQWLWTTEHTHHTAFKEVKQLLTSPQTLKLYSPNKPTKLRVDASKLHGMSVILYQQHDNMIGTQLHAHQDI